MGLSVCVRVLLVSCGGRGQAQRLSVRHCDEKHGRLVTLCTIFKVQFTGVQWNRECYSTAKTVGILVADTVWWRHDTNGNCDPGRSSKRRVCYEGRYNTTQQRCNGTAKGNVTRTVLHELCVVEQGTDKIELFI